MVKSGCDALLLATAAVSPAAAAAGDGVTCKRRMHREAYFLWGEYKSSAHIRVRKEREGKKCLVIIF